VNLSILSSRLAFAAVAALSVLAFGCCGAQTRAGDKPCCKGEAATADKPCCKGEAAAADKPCCKGEAPTDKPCCKGEAPTDKPCCKGEAAADKPCCKGEAAADKPCCKGKVEATAPDAAAPAAAEPFKRVDAASLEVKLKGAAQVYVFDANSDERFAQGHIPGAKHLRADAVKAEVLPPNQNAMVVFYCGGPKCMAAPDAARATIALRYTNVFVMTDGIKGWEALGYPVEK
jgi:rhodanese-related sulfurtransferase